MCVCAHMRGFSYGCNSHHSTLNAVIMLALCQKHLFKATHTPGGSANSALGSSQGTVGSCSQLQIGRETNLASSIFSVCILQ